MTLLERDPVTAISTAPVSEAAASPSSRPPARRDIQRLRGVAVLGVVLFHAGFLVSGGYAGVDVFFVISGFLITTHLLTHPPTGIRALLDFYARRARRIIPAAFTVLVVTVAVAAAALSPLTLEHVLTDAKWTALYAPNVHFASIGTDYLAEHSPSLLQHYWSLGIEEQFYLFWPLTLIALHGISRGRRTAVAVGIAVLAAISFVHGFVLTGSSQPDAFFLLPSRAWELAAGGLVAAVALRLPLLRAPLRRLLAALGWLAIGIAFTAFDAHTVFPGAAAALPVLGAVLVIGAGSASAFTSQEPTGLAALAARALEWVGELSYSLYLVHWPALVLPLAATGFVHPLPMWVNVSIVVGCFPAAWVLRRLVEEPLRRPRWLTRAGPARTLIPTALLSLLIAAVCWFAAGKVADAPIASDRSAPETVDGRAFVPDYVPSDLTPSLRSVQNDVPSLYASGCHAEFDQSVPRACSFGSGRTIALYGDSHAAQWFPALRRWAGEHGYRVLALTKSSCPSADVPMLVSGVPYRSCTAWRTDALRIIRQERPSLVILAGDAPDSGADPTTWRAGLTRTATEVQHTSPALILADTPRLAEEPAACLARNVDSALQCARPVSSAVPIAFNSAAEQSASRTGASFADLDDRVCVGSQCPAIIGDHLVYRDAHHLTATFSTTLAAALGHEVQRALNAAGPR